MKKMLSFAVLALFAGIAANAQIAESKSKKIETTYTTTTNTVEVQQNKNYDRIYMSYAPTSISEYDLYGENLMMHGVGFGWKKGINVTKNRKLPLYLETGIAANFAFGEGDKLFNFNVPVNITYRFKLGNTKIYIAPYWGLNFKVNYLWTWGFHDDRSWFKYEQWNPKRFQLGTEFGANFDIYNFHLGVGWTTDFMKLAEVDYSNSYFVHKFGTSGVRVNVGVTF